MKQQEILKLSIEDVKTQISNMTEKLSKMKLTHGVAPLENPLQIKHTRRAIARLKTELKKREVEA